MTPFPSERVQELLTEALKCPASDRLAFLDESCADDPAVRSEVEQLLAAHEDAGEFLSPPAAENFLDYQDRAELALGTSSGPRIGDQIGRYKLLELLGEGGFGTVFLAEQARPIRRKVALKVIKPGMDSRQVLARFSAERQALALMDHTNIAKVYDAGQTKSGRPYVVMEVVDGPTITEYCKLHRLTTDQRVELFISVGHAVQHAHQKGIIHRDLKPSNVLVMTEQNRAVPKVIDFGIAKALGGSLCGQSFLTEQRQLLGTPEYVSPEQAGMGEMGIDTRTDVYSLGVLLYELLTGTTPFDPQALRKASFYQMQRMIIEEDPPRPSSRLSKIGTALREAADARRVEPHVLRRQLKGDLDAIVMKCLRKSPKERYETAAALADDLNRFLHDEPVTAAAAGNVYQLKKLVKRHRAWFAGGLAVALALASGTVVSTVLYFRADAAGRQQVILKNQADRSARAAQKSASYAESINRFLLDTLGFADPENSGRANMPLRDVLGLAERKLDFGALAGQPEFEASVRAQLAKIDESVGLFENAEQQIAKAMALWQHVSEPDYRGEAEAVQTLADTYWTISDYRRAAQAYRHAIALLELTHGPHSAEVAQTWIMLGRMLMYSGQLDSARDPLTHGLDLLAAAKGPSSLDYANTLRHLETYESRQDHPDQVLVIRAQRRRIYSALLMPPERQRLSDAAVAQVRRELEYPYDQEQERLLTRALEQRRARHGEYDPGVARAMEDLAECLIYSCRDYPEAQRLLNRSLEIRRTLYGPNHPRVSDSLTLLATFLEWRGKYDEAVKDAQRSLSILEHTYGPSSHEAMREKLRLALREERLGDYDSAGRHVREVVDNNNAGADIDQWRLRTRLAAYLLWTQCDYEHAEQLCRQLLDRNPTEDPNSAAPTLWLLANVLISEDRPIDALEVSRQAVECCTTGASAALVGRGVKITAWETHARALFLARRPASEVDFALDEAQKLWDEAPESFKQVPHDGTGFTAVDRTAHPRFGQRAEVLLNVGRYAAALEAAKQAVAQCTTLGFPSDSRQTHFLNLMLAVAQAGSGTHNPAGEQAALQACAAVEADPHILAVYKVEARRWIAGLYAAWGMHHQLEAWNAHTDPTPLTLRPDRFTLKPNALRFPASSPSDQPGAK